MGYCGICDEETTVNDGVCDGCGTDYFRDRNNLIDLNKELDLMKRCKRDGWKTYPRENGFFPKDFCKPIDNEILILQNRIKDYYHEK